MPRPQKAKQVCRLPVCASFGPKRKEHPEADSRNGENHKVILLVEEYETIRLMDYLGMSQAECASRMGVARATVQALYADGRKKIARCLAEGADLEIQGGNYQLCSRRFCRQKKMACYERGEENQMKIAVTYENGQVFQHFGHTEQFKIYEVENGQILKEEVADTNGSGHGALAGFLQELGVSVLICGGIGGGARNALSEAGIRLYPGASGDADQQVKAFLAGSLDYNPDTVCSHHEHHGEGHDCGNHGEGHDCGSHGCH
ncbi:MAG: NifB/NifX family molybdenum-iron cluster-binding protein [Lachnospiraceae bacterium]|nr:NifB/NifX family molybdenum-iron cluster-binding protein [Lachnospiraceae bacterium]